VTGSVKPPLELKKRKLSTRQFQLANFSVGHQGELQALQFLKQKNYRIINTNVALGKSEVDIIAFDETAKELVFIEVKTRSRAGNIHGSQAISRQKLKSISRVAGYFIKVNKYHGQYRIDAICITSGEIEHFENISWW
jgi:putative endonuclease